MTLAAPADRLRLIDRPGLLTQLSWGDLQKLRDVVLKKFFHGLYESDALRVKLRNNPRVIKQVDQFIEQVLPTVMEKRLAAQIEKQGVKRSLT